MSGPCDYFFMEESCDCFDMIEFVQSFDMGINFLLGPPTPSEVIFIPSVDADGNLSWSNNGGLPNPPPVNIKGPPGSGGGDVQSVNGKTGAVVLTSVDVGLGNVDNVRQYSANNPPPYPVTSVDGQTGAVVLSYYGANNPPPYPVTSVNGQTGDVVISAGGSALHISGASFSSLPHTIYDASITSSMRVIEYTLGTPNAIVSDLSWVTANGSITLSGSMAASSSTTIEIVLIETN